MFCFVLSLLTKQYFNISITLLLLVLSDIFPLCFHELCFTLSCLQWRQFHFFPLSCQYIIIISLKKKKKNESVLNCCGWFLRGRNTSWPLFHLVPPPPICPKLCKWSCKMSRHVQILGNFHHLFLRLSISWISGKCCSINFFLCRLCLSPFCFRDQLL